MSFGDPNPPEGTTPNETLARNRATYDRMAVQGRPLCKVASPEDLRDPMSALDAAGWLGKSVRGWKVLCLAAGGGRQSSLYAAAGAEVTVVDLSPAMLEQDREMARAHGFKVRVIETSMEDLSGLATAHFDLVAQPVSTCYVRHVQNVYRQVARVLRPGGLYLSQHKSPVSLQTATDRDHEVGYVIRHAYYRDEPIPGANEQTANAKRLREAGTTEYLHRWEELIGGLCRCGFVIEDMLEPVHTDSAVACFADRARFVAPYLRIKARRQSDDNDSDPNRPKLWLA